jgi:hypothetical protein
MDHVSFWWELIGRVDAPVFAGTLVACLLSRELTVMHGVLMATGLGMMALGHWGEHHKNRRARAG